MQNRFKILIYTEIAYIILSVIFALLIRSILHLMMGFNMFLALIPFYLTYRLKKTKQIKTITFILIFIVWLLFFPNTFYFLTDLIHVTKLNIYYYQNTGIDSVIVYFEDIIEWLKLAHLMLGSIGGALLGLASLYEMQQILESRKVKFINYILVGIIILSGVGIYIGRFLRFNSWDIFNPYMIFKTLLLRFNLFALLFILLISTIISVFYFTFYHIIKERVNVQD